MVYAKVKAIGMAAVIAAVSFAASSAPAPVTFAGLQPGERIEVNYTMSGCFASEHLTLSFWRGKALQVEIHRFVRDQDGKERRVRLGQITLSKADERGLDNLLRFYRSKPQGNCTTMEISQIVQLRNGRELAKESYTDRSCSSSSEMLGFGELGRWFGPAKR